MTRFPSKSSVHTFAKAQVASFAATIADFGTLTVWVEVFKQFYPYGVALGAALGAVTNFLINRYWSFEAGDQKLHSQAIRYVLVSGGSLILNTLFVYLLTDYLTIHYMISKIITAFFVGIFYNYPLHRYFVYPMSQATAKEPAL